jgi:hypothetical protein
MLFPSTSIKHLIFLKSVRNAVNFFGRGLILRNSEKNYQKFFTTNLLLLHHLKAGIEMQEKMVGSRRIELRTRGFSVLCSTD